MKKTLILLSAIILAVGGVGAMSMTGTKEVKRETSTGALGSDPLSGEKLPNIARSADKIFPDENAQGSALILSEVNFKKNQLVVRINRDGDWMIRRVIVAYWDYEKGATMAEADANLGTLGVENGLPWKFLWDYTDSGSPSIYMYATPKANGQKMNVKDNLTDVLYYAIEYGHKTGENWQDIRWERGKINYRNCGHAAVFDRATMICMRESDRSYSVNDGNYTKVTVPAGAVVSWDEEWNAIQRQRYNDVMGKLEELKRNLYGVTGILDGAEQVLGNLEVTLPKAMNMADQGAVQTEVARLKTLAQTMRAYYAEINTAAAKEEVEKLRREKVNLENNQRWIEEENADLRGRVAKLAEIEAENVDLKAKKTEVEAEKVKIEAENADLKAKVAKLTLDLANGAPGANPGGFGASETPGAGNGAVEAAGAAGGGNEALEEKNETAGEKNETKIGAKNGVKNEEVVGEIGQNWGGEAAGEVEGAEVGSTAMENEKGAGEAEKGVVVPKLGEGEKKGRKIEWLVAATGVGAVITAGLGVGQRLRKRRK